jgi:hypothetical protein
MSLFYVRSPSCNTQLLSSSCPSVLIYRRAHVWRITWYFVTISVMRICNFLNSDNNIRYLTLSPQCVSCYREWNLYRKAKWNVSFSMTTVKCVFQQYNGKKTARFRGKNGHANKLQCYVSRSLPFVLHLM